MVDFSMAEGMDFDEAHGDLRPESTGSRSVIFIVDRSGCKISEGWTDDPWFPWCSEMLREGKSRQWSLGKICGAIRLARAKATWGLLPFITLACFAGFHVHSLDSSHAVGARWGRSDSGDRVFHFVQPLEIYKPWMALQKTCFVKSLALAE